MDYREEIKRITSWLQEKVTEAGAKGLVVGLSGGIDSSVVAALSKRAFPNSVVGVVMPCHSTSSDAEHGLLVANTFDIPVHTVDLSSTFDTFLATIRDQVPQEPNQLTVANIKPRLRMTTLYYFAGLHCYLVAGTGNRSELEIGYFTKYGDGGVDMEPIGHLLKTDVRGIARELGVPQPIIDKSPSAGLWSGQTDEDEMGITYEELDSYLATGKCSQLVQDRTKKLQKISEHKRNMPPVPQWPKL